MVKLGDVVNQSSESERNPVEEGLNRVVGLEHIDSDDLHIKRWDDIGDGTSFTKRFRKGQVLFGRRRAYLRKVAYAEFDGICSGDITVLESKGDGLLPELLPFIVQTEGFYEHTQKVSAGGLSPRAKWRDLATYELPLPPITEQQRIAEILLKADECFDKNLSCLALARATRSQALRQLSGVKERRVHPAGARVVKFGELAECITERVDDPAEAGVERYVGLEHLDSESLKIARWGKPTDVEATKLHFYPGDIIFGKRRFYQRKLAVADFEGICSAHAFVLRVRRETVEPDFLPYFMLSGQFFDRAMMISVGGLSPTINWSTIARQEFAIPARPEQRRIADTMLKMDDCILKTASGLALARTAAAMLRETLLSGGSQAFEHSVH
jgi:restriction endonuclease S subunit